MNCQISSSFHVYGVSFGLEERHRLQGFGRGANCSALRLMVRVAIPVPKRFISSSLPKEWIELISQRLYDVQRMQLSTGNYQRKYFQQRTRRAASSKFSMTYKRIDCFPWARNQKVIRKKLANIRFSLTSQLKLNGCYHFLHRSIVQKPNKEIIRRTNLEIRLPFPLKVLQ